MSLVMKLITNKKYKHNLCRCTDSNSYLVIFISISNMYEFNVDTGMRSLRGFYVQTS